MPTQLVHRHTSAPVCTYMHSCISYLALHDIVLFTLYITLLRLTLYITHTCGESERERERERERESERERNLGILVEEAPFIDSGWAWLKESFGWVLVADVFILIARLGTRK